MWRCYVLVTEAEILASTYFDICTIERYEDFEDPETGITKQGWKAYVTNEACALSQNNTKDGLSVVEGTGIVNVTYDDQKVFLSPGIDVIKGDRIKIKQSTGHEHIFYAKKPFFYPTHTEIYVTGRDVNG